MKNYKTWTANPRQQIKNVFSCKWSQGDCNKIKLVFGKMCFRILLTDLIISIFPLYPHCQYLFITEFNKKCFNDMRRECEWFTCVLGRVKNSVQKCYPVT